MVGGRFSESSAAVSGCLSPPLPGRPRRRRAPGVEGVDDRAPGAPLVAAPPVPSPPLSLSLSSPASMARWRIWRPRSRAVPFLSLLLLAPLVFTVSRLQLSWSPEKGLCLPPPAAPEGRRQCLPPPTAPRLPRPDRLVLGPAAGQGRPDRLQCQGLKAVNKIGLSSERNYSRGHVTFVTVFTTYNSDPAEASKLPSNVVTVGKHSYSKVGRSMAILNTFIGFIQNLCRCQCQEAT